MSRPPFRLLIAMIALALTASACSGASPTIDASQTTGDVALIPAGEGENLETDETEETDGTDVEFANREGLSTDDGLVDQGESTGEDADAMGEDDQNAPNATVPVDGDDRPPSTVTIPAGVPAADADALREAALKGNDIEFVSPYIYLTVEQECAGCAETVSLYYTPDADDISRHAFAKAFVDGSEQGSATVHPTLLGVDPLFVAESLLGFISAGDQVTYSIDPVSGLVTTWTVNGERASIRCLQIDTRPIDMRSELCSGSIVG